ncbi:MAG: hypothetical protein ACI87J_000649 [Colwellia sp.]|jgi:hypothetical protein
MLVQHDGVLLQHDDMLVQHNGVLLQHRGISIQHDRVLAEECLTLEVIIKRYTNLSWCAKALIFFSYPI